MSDPVITKEGLAELHVSLAQALAIILSLPNQTEKMKQDARTRANMHIAEAHRLNSQYPLIVL